MKSPTFPKQLDNDSGSPNPGEPEFLVVGKFGKPHGIQGEIVMDIYTDFPERLQPGVTIFVGSQYAAHKIVKRRPHPRGLLVMVENYRSREAAAELRNQFVYVAAADRPELEDGEYYHHQLLGMNLVDENGQYVGKLVQILQTGANDVYVVHDTAGAEILIPAIDSVILNIDLEEKQMQVHLLPGILPED